MERMQRISLAFVHINLAQNQTYSVVSDPTVTGTAFLPRFSSFFLGGGDSVRKLFKESEGTNSLPIGCN